MPQDTSLPRANSLFVKGAKDGLPFVIVIVPFGAIFGAIATQVGLNIAEVMGFSLLVIAGASQLAAVQLLTENAPTLIVIATALAVNLRMAMYSASLTPYIGSAPVWKRVIAAYFMFDQPYALSIMEYEKKPDLPVHLRLSYYFGTAIPIATEWYIATLAGALLAERIPPELGVDFAVPVTFLAVVAPMLKSPAHIAAALTSAVGVLVLGFMPFGTGLLAAALLALIVGALVEVWLEKREAGA